MPGEIYSADEVIDKNLITKRSLPYYSGVPEGSHQPAQLGVFPAGTNAGIVYSWVDANPAEGRPDLWWIFYPVNGVYYYMPHRTGDFDTDALQQQGAESEEEKNNPQQWYEKILTQVLPVVALTVLGAAAIRGYFGRK